MKPRDLRERVRTLLSFGRALQPRARLALAGSSLIFIALVFATCGACRRGTGGGPTTVPSASAGPIASTSASAIKLAAADAGVINPLMWSHARRGDAESLQTLAVHEGSAGLIDAAEHDATLRLIAIQAMGYAEGWAQMPFLAKSASSSNDDEARLALDAILELAARPRTSVDPEDADELGEGCAGLLTIAKDAEKSRVRRVRAIRALRMMPCPKPEEVPTDLDAK